MVDLVDQCFLIEFDAETLSLAIVTHAIEMEGIYLGPFRIELALDQLHPVSILVLMESPLQRHFGVFCLNNRLL